MTTLTNKSKQNVLKIWDAIHKKWTDSVSKEEDISKEEAKIVFDFYISMPNTYNSLQEYVNSHPLILATNNGSHVINLFHQDNNIIKLKDVPIDAIKYYSTAKDASRDTINSVFFKSFDGVDNKKKHDIIKHNDYDIFKIDITTFVRTIKAIDDTPGDDGLAKDSILEQINNKSKSLSMIDLIGSKL